MSWKEHWSLSRMGTPCDPQGGRQCAPSAQAYPLSKERHHHRAREVLVFLVGEKGQLIIQKQADVRAGSTSTARFRRRCAAYHRLWWEWVRSVFWRDTAPAAT